MKWKRKKSKRSVRCTLCTKHRWLGNRKGRYLTAKQRGYEIKAHTSEAVYYIGSFW